MCEPIFMLVFPPHFAVTNFFYGEEKMQSYCWQLSRVEVNRLSSLLKEELIDGVSTSHLILSGRGSPYK